MNKEMLQKSVKTLVLSLYFFILTASIQIGSEMENKNGFNFSHTGRVVLISLVVAVGFTIFFQKIFKILKEKFYQKFPERETTQKKMFFFLAWGIIFLLWLPYFFIFYPGVWGYDIKWQLEYVTSGSYSTHHPLIHTLFVGLSVWFQKWFGMNETTARSVVTLLQILIMSGLFAKTVQIVKVHTNKVVYALSIAFFALFPLHPAMAVNHTKDGLFTAFVVAFIASFYDLWKTNLSKTKVVQFLVFLVFASLLRNNFIYALGVCFFILLVIQAFKRTIGKKIVVMFAGILLFFMVSTGLKFSLHATPSIFHETMSIPLQQVARVYNTEPPVVSTEEKEYMASFFKPNALKKYDPNLADPVKFNFIPYGRMKEFLKYWAKLGLRFTGIYLNAFFEQSRGFWDFSSYHGLGFTSNNSFPREMADKLSKAPKLRQSISDGFNSGAYKNIPVIGCLFNPPFSVWILLFLLAVSVYFSLPSSMTITGLVTLYWGTMLLGPLSRDTRYLYPFVALMPVVLALVLSEWFYKKSKEEEKAFQLKEFFQTIKKRSSKENAIEK